MALSQEEINKIHEEEAERAKARAQYTPQSPQTVITKKKTGCVTWGCLTIVILVAISLLIGTCSAIVNPTTTPAKNSQQSNSENNDEPSDASNDLVGIGENGILDTGSEDVLLGITKEDNDQIVHSYVINDLDAVTQMVLDGKAFFVPAKTKILVIDSDFPVKQVRILEGDFNGESGWVPYEFIKPSE